MAQFDVDEPLRAAYVTALRGKIFYDAGEIPVVDEKLDHRISEHNIYVKISNQNTTQQNNKRRFAAQVDLRAEIVHRSVSVGGKVVVDNIANQVLQLLFPDKKSTTLTLAPPLHLTFARLESSDTSSLLQIDTGFLMMKTLVFFNRVTQG